MDLLKHIPFECAVCGIWPSAAFEGVRGVCKACVVMHARAPHFALPHGLDACAAALTFDAPWAGLIAHYKFSPEPGLAALFAGLMLRDERIRVLLASADVVMPLPLSSERLQERGFNQAVALTKHLVSGASTPRIDTHALVRTRDTTPQRTLDRSARQRNVAHAFAMQALPSMGYARQLPSLEGQRVLLVDDVMTTGATLAAAAAPLRKAGAAVINAVVIAWTPVL